FPMYSCPLAVPTRGAPEPPYRRRPFPRHAGSAYRHRASGLPRTTPPARPLFHEAPRAAPAAGHARGRAARALPAALAGALALFVVPAAAAGGTSGTSPAAVVDAGRPVPHVLWATPFAALLLAIAVLPVVPVAHHWWERNGFKLAVGLALGGVV